MPLAAHADGQIHAPSTPPPNAHGLHCVKKHQVGVLFRQVRIPAITPIVGNRRLPMPAQHWDDGLENTGN